MTSLFSCADTHPYYFFLLFDFNPRLPFILLKAPIAQSVEHGANNARVVGSSPGPGLLFYHFCSIVVLFYSSIFFVIFFLSFSLFSYYDALLVWLLFCYSHFEIFLIVFIFLFFCVSLFHVVIHFVIILFMCHCCFV